MSFSAEEFRFQIPILVLKDWLWFCDDFTPAYSELIHLYLLWTTVCLSRQHGESQILIWIENADRVILNKFYVGF